MLRSPGQLGVGRAYVSGALDVDDVEAALALLDTWKPAADRARATARKLAAAAVRAGALRSVPHVPDAELRPRGRRHSVARDRRSVRHHYDVSNEFFELFLGESMTYSCAIFSRGATTLEEAQEAKLELVCTKLGLEPGHARARRRLRLGQLRRARRDAPRRARHRHHAVGAAGGARPRARASRRGSATRSTSACRTTASSAASASTASPRSAWSSTSARSTSTPTPQHVVDALEPGGVLLNHGIARLRHGDPEAGPFSERFVFPDAAPLHLSRIVSAFEKTGTTIDHVEGFAPDYAETLRHWARRLDDRIDEAIRLAGEERVRVWRLYLRAARRGFESGFTSRLPGQSARLIAAATRFAPGAPSRIE